MDTNLWKLMFHRRTLKDDLDELGLWEKRVEEEEANLFHDATAEQKDTAKADQTESDFTKVEQMLVDLSEHPEKAKVVSDMRHFLKEVHTYLKSLYGEEDSLQRCVLKNEQDIKHALEDIQKEMQVLDRTKHDIEKKGELNEDVLFTVAEIRERINELHDLYDSEGQELIKVQNQLIRPFDDVLIELEVLDRQITHDVKKGDESAIEIDDATIIKRVHQLTDLIRQIHEGTLRTGEFNRQAADIEITINELFDKLRSLVVQ